MNGEAWALGSWFSVFEASALPLTSCVILEKLPSSSALCFPTCEIGILIPIMQNCCGNECVDIGQLLRAVLAPNQDCSLTVCMDEHSEDLWNGGDERKQGLTGTEKKCPSKRRNR